MLTPGLSLLRLAFRRSLASAPQSSGVSKKKVECFYDVLSPYSGIGFEIICRYRSLWNLDLHFRPVFFMGILKAIGSQPPAMLPKKGDYILKDAVRMGKYCQVPLNLPKDFVNAVVVKGSLPAMRFITAVDIAEPQFVEPVSRELWMRLWSRDEDIVQPESILAVAEKAGLPSGKSQELLKMSTSPDVKNRLKETTDEALKLGFKMHQHLQKYRELDGWQVIFRTVRKLTSKRHLECHLLLSRLMDNRSFSLVQIV